jgi:hypothetical protein
MKPGRNSHLTHCCPDGPIFINCTNMNGQKKERARGTERVDPSLNEDERGKGTRIYGLESTGHSRGPET